MTDILDPVELLNSMSPLAGWDDPTDLATDERAASILERVVSGNVIPFRAPRRRLKIATGVVVTFTLGGLGVAALLQRSADEDRVVSCWSEAAPDPAAKAGLAWDGTVDPAILCLRPWSDGTLGSNGPPAPLQLCLTTEENVVAAIPGDDVTCDALGLAPFTPPPSPQGDPLPPADELDEQVDGLEALLKKKYNQGECFTVEEAVEGVRRTLEEFKFDGWATQAVSTSGAADTCASVAVDREVTTINVATRIPSPDAPN